VLDPNDRWTTTSAFLLEEYRQFFTAFMANEESGERRVSIFLTIATVAVTGLGVAAGLGGGKIARRC